MKKQNKDEPLLDPKNSRLVLFPIQHEDIWHHYKGAESLIWSAGEVDLSNDVKQYQEVLNDKERHFLNHVLAFFAASDNIVCANLGENFLTEVQYPEAQFYYGLQLFIEQVHSEMYSLLIDSYVSDTAQKMELFNAIETFPAVKKKAEWALKWIESDNFVERLIAFSAVEGIHFSGSFCAIFWLKDRGVMPGLCQSNEFISRDEGLHRDFACMLYRDHVKNKLPEERVKEIILDALETEKEFIIDALPVEMIGMNSKLMTQYLEFVTDHLLSELGIAKVFNTTNPFPFMEMISVDRTTNFFEHRVTEYQRPGTIKGAEDEDEVFKDI